MVVLVVVIYREVVATDCEKCDPDSSVDGQKDPIFIGICNY